MTIALATPAAANQQCPEPDPSPNGIQLWEGAGPLTFKKLALLAAPVLWFTADEPLKYACKGKMVFPEPLPPSTHPDELDKVRCQGPSVSYLVTRFRTGGTPPTYSSGGSEYGDRVLNLSAAADEGALYLRWWFFYTQDFGVNGHPVDLEGATFELRLERRANGAYALFLAKVKGAAHGLNWSANRLDVTSSDVSGMTAVPMTLLIEEGKHATGPDRNGDGHYTPGYDVNRLVSDAWGIRDTFGSGLLGTRYAAYDTKAREEAGRVFPAYPADPDLDCLKTRYERRRPWSTLTYKVEPACGNAEVCSPQEVVRRVERLASITTYGVLSVDRAKTPASTPHLNPMRSDVTPWVRAMDAIPLSYRYDGDHALAIVGWPLRVPAVNVHVAPRVVLDDAEELRNVSLLLSPSLSRWLDWYAAPGWNINHEGFRLEGGIRYRWKPLWLNGRLPFIGGRLGVSVAGFGKLRHPRLVLEVGGGFM